MIDKASIISELEDPFRNDTKQKTKKDFADTWIDAITKMGTEKHVNPGTDTTINPVVIDDSKREKKQQNDCRYLLRRGMSVLCIDSTDPPRNTKCDHCLSPQCFAFYTSAPSQPTEAQQPPHPLRCETCENKECEYWEVHPHMSARHDHDTGWTASPGVITFSKGCASHTSAGQQRIEQVDKKLCQLGDMIHEIQYAGKVSAEVINDLDAVLEVYREVREAIALLQAGRK